MRTLTRCLLILAVAVALAAFTAFEPHAPDGQACPQGWVDCEDCREPEVQLACPQGMDDCKDCREPEVQLASGGDEKLVPIPDPISTPGATPATQLACPLGVRNCKDCREPAPQLAGTEIGNGDAPVVEMQLADCDASDGSCGDAPVLEMGLACDMNTGHGCDNAPVLETGLA
jgi:hypothetical protein